MSAVYNGISRLSIGHHRLDAGSCTKLARLHMFTTVNLASGPTRVHGLQCQTVVKRARVSFGALYWRRQPLDS